MGPPDGILPSAACRSFRGAQGGDRLDSRGMSQIDPSGHSAFAAGMALLALLRHSLRRAGRGILPFGSARSVWSNTPSRPLGSDRNDVAANCRDVEGNHRLGQAPQGERAELLGFDASFERRVDALAEQDFQVDAAGGGGAVGAVGVAVGSLVDPLPVPGLIAPWALPFRSRKSALRWATRRFTGRAAM